MPATPSVEATIASASDRPIRAMLDVMGAQRNELGEYVDRIPARRFGKSKARILRKFVLLAIAANADPDGTSSHPSVFTLARRCLVTEEAIRKVLTWLKKHHLLHIESKGARTSKYGNTNKYTILWQEPVRKTRVKKHPQIEVGYAPKAHPTTEDRIPNNSQEDTQQLSEGYPTIDGAHPNRSWDNRPGLPPFIDRPSLPSSIPSSREQTNSDAGANDDGDKQSLSTPENLRAGISAKESFLVEQQRILNQFLDNPKSTAKQREESWRVAQAMGFNLYLGTLTVWCEAYSEEDTTIGYKDHFSTNAIGDIETKRYPVSGSWPLKMFLDSPNRTLVAEEINPIVDRFGWHGADELLFLYRTHDEALRLTPEQLSTLRDAASDDWGWVRFKDLYEWNNYSFDTLLLDPAAALARYDEERKAEDKRSQERIEKIRAAQQRRSVLVVPA